MDFLVKSSETLYVGEFMLFFMKNEREGGYFVWGGYKFKLCILSFEKLPKGSEFCNVLSNILCGSSWFGEA